MNGHGEKRTRKREQAIAALLTAPSVAEAAGRADLGEATLRRWLREPGFAAAYRAARRHTLEPVVGRLQQAASAAVGEAFPIQDKSQIRSYGPTLGVPDADRRPFRELPYVTVRW